MGISDSEVTGDFCLFLFACLIVYGKIRRIQEEKENHKGRQSRDGIKVKVVLGSVYSLPGVGQICPWCFFQSPSEKKTMSVTNSQCSERKTDLLLKRITTILSTKISQEFVLEGLLKRPQCEVTSRHP